MFSRFSLFIGSLAVGMALAGCAAQQGNVTPPVEEEAAPTAEEAMPAADKAADTDDRAMEAVEEAGN